ncbi:MAG: sulfatase-like hydrolase/transferase, partial [Gammaproteobacteria bacterium]|nr:sulfatase-like hydrolase/transferase [Gammaproteobacteria bacterium]
MCDQLRYDYLSCYGHQSLNTANIDRLAERGVTFTNAYSQAPLCAPSRASFYTGRYMSSHGVMGNDDATRIDEKMMADYLRPLGYRTAVIGKTHSFKNRSTMAELGIDMTSELARTA